MMMDYPKKKTVLDLFLAQVKKTPDNIAVVFNNKKITYKELDKLSNQFANYIISAYGINTNDLVSVMIDRSEWIIICFIGILKSGSAYVPIDPGYPEKRKNYIQNDSQSRITIDESFLNEFINKIDKLSSEKPKVKVSPHSLCYIIYTSGTTGNPKGVMIEHRNVVSLLSNGKSLFNLNENDVWCMFHSFCFDVSVWEMYGALLYGGKLIVPPKSTVKDPFEFMSFISKEGITILNQTPSAFINLMESVKHSAKVNLNVRYIIFAGEALYPKYLAKWYDQYPEIKLVNMYGITEITVHATFKQIKKPEIDSNQSNIGSCIPTLSAYILNEFKKPQPTGVVGELYIAGEGLARGYLNRPELTKEKFLPSIFKEGERMYRSGDLAKWLPNGEIEFVGRIDNQVKIRGFRIELSEVEAALNSLSNIKRSVVITSDHIAGEPSLVAYLQPTNAKGDSNTVRNQLKEILPDFQIPSMFMWIDNFPLNSNGKIDKKNLPKPEYQRPESAPMFRSPRTSIEKTISKIWSDQLQIPLSKIGIDDNFFDLGGTSLLVQKTISQMREELTLDLSVSNIYTHPTISELSIFSEENTKYTGPFVFKTSSDKKQLADIAIIGMAGRFPGAESIDELWDVIRDGKETISFFTKEELDSSIPDDLCNDPLYVKARGILPLAETFDNDFFGLNPLLAKAMDPQQRLFLEICWELLEQAGHLPKHYKGSIGVYAGCEYNSYFENNILLNTEMRDLLGYMLIYSVNGKDFIAPRISYHLNLKGPSVSLHSACSTSLLAVAEAVQAIRGGQCNVALAGGSSVTSPIYSGHLYDEGYILNPDGHTRPFDASGKGTVFSDGAGVVLLKSLEAAKKEGDKIYGVIKGIGVNNDGGNRGSFMTPNSNGQAGAIVDALNDAQIHPSTITYVEAHGTATPVGDPIEFEGLKVAYGKQEKNGYCALGSVKANFGHTTAAAGVAGLIKTILSMQHKQLPPLVGFENPNPNLDFQNSPFYINDKLRNWDVEGPRRAGVSSFGVGSTNVHVIVEEFEMESSPSGKDKDRPSQLLTWSANSKKSLSGYQTELGKFINQLPDNQSLADVAYSLSVTREEFSHRSFCVADSNMEASKKLISPENNGSKSKVVNVVPNEKGFLFPGQGSQYLQMGKTLYDNEKVYRDAIDECADLLMTELKLDIREIIYPKSNSIEAEKLLKNTFYTQPALFITEYALAQLWISWGIKPTLLCGHSVGEFVAAHLAGVFSLKDALYAIASRSRLISELPGGSMLSVRLPEKRLIELLPKTLSIAAVNSKHLSVVSGEDKDIEDFAKIMKSQDVPHKILFTSHAFHSSMMDPMLESFEEALRKVTLNIPRLPVISTVTGTWLTDSEATSIDYWVGHVKNTVRFADAMDTILGLENVVLLEVGPGKSLTSLTQQQAADKIISVFNSLNLPEEGNHNEYTSVLNALGNMWIQGINPNWKAFYNERQGQRINLPGYVFDRKPCWADPMIYNGLSGFGYNNTKVVQMPSNDNQETITSKTIDDSLNKEEGLKKDDFLHKISEIINHTCGIIYGPDAYSNTFLELGLDSLILAQLSVKIKKEFNLPVSFRQLNEELATPNLLADYLEKNITEIKKIEESKDSQDASKDAPISTNSSVESSSKKQQITISSDRKRTINTDDIIEEKNDAKAYSVIQDKPPMPGAKLGRDEKGNPAWFIEDSNHPGKYIKINL